MGFKMVKYSIERLSVYLGILRIILFFREYYVGGIVLICGIFLFNYFGYKEGLVFRLDLG